MISPTCFEARFSVKTLKSNSGLAMLGCDVRMFISLSLLFINIYSACSVATPTDMPTKGGIDCLGCNGVNKDYIHGNQRYEEMPLNYESKFDYRAASLLQSPFYETVNNRSIYSSLTKIIYQLKNQLERNRLSNRSGKSDAPPENNRVNNNKTQVNRTESKVNQTEQSGGQSDSINKTATITLEIIGEPLTETQQQQYRPGETRRGDKPSPLPSTRQKFTPAEAIRDRQPIEPNKIVLSRWQPAATKSPVKFMPERRKTTERSSRNNKKLEEPDGGGDLASGLMDQLLGDPINDDDPRYRNPSPSNQATTLWSRPIPVAPQNIITIDNIKQTGPTDDGREHDRTAAASNEFMETSYRRPLETRRLNVIEATSLRGNDYFASSSDQQSQQPDDEDRAPVLNPTQSPESGTKRVRMPMLGPQSIRLQQVYPQKATLPEPISDPHQGIPSKTYTPNYGERDDLSYKRNVGGRQVAPTNSLFNHMHNNQNPDIGASNYHQAQVQTRLHQLQLHQQPQPQPQPPFPRDLLDQPQTIQITAIPNDNVLANGILGGIGGGVNQVLRINTNGQFNNMWNNGFLDPFGRPVMMVNAERRQLDWSFWIWPLVAIVTLPLILSALFVPIFLKTVVLIIQLLQSLGLLSPIANALGQQIAFATGSSTASATLASLSNNNQLQAEHHQKDGLVEVRNVTMATVSNSTI